MSDFPQMKWVEVNGKMTPFTKPQHYKEGSTTETVLTGYDNPLPVANFTKKGTLWLPVGENNPMHTQNEDVETRLQNIEDKLDSVIEDGSVNTQVIGSNVELGVYSGSDLSTTVATSFKKQQGASKAIFEYVLDKKDENENGRISIRSLTRLTGSRQSTFEMVASELVKSGRVLFFWGFDEITHDSKGTDILYVESTNVPPINEFAQILTFENGGVFDVTLNISWFS